MKKTNVSFVRITGLASVFKKQYNEGMRIPEIAKINKVSTPTVRKYLREQHVKIKPQGWHLRYPFRKWSEQNEKHENARSNPLDKLRL